MLSYAFQVIFSLFFYFVSSYVYTSLKKILTDKTKFNFKVVGYVIFNTTDTSDLSILKNQKYQKSAITFFKSIERKVFSFMLYYKKTTRSYKISC